MSTGSCRSVMDALTRPLTEEEKKSGTWAPKEPRILFEGTLEEAEEFYSQTENIPGILNAPFAMYTDGLPVVIPTEERVEEMLKGTSHKPDEMITLQRDTEIGGMEKSPRRKQSESRRRANRFSSCPCTGPPPWNRWPSTPSWPDASRSTSRWCWPWPNQAAAPVTAAAAAAAFIVSGPIYKEIGMNVSYGRFGPGNPANKTIGRVGSLMWRNLGGYKETVTTIMTYGSPVTNGGFMLAEYAEGLPPGWKGLNEELGFKKDESVLMTMQRRAHGASARSTCPASTAPSRRPATAPSPGSSTSKASRARTTTWSI